MIRTRFAPSPTGLLHLGNVRAALFSSLYAMNCHGKFVLRIEDTDIARSSHEYTESLQDDLHWLGIDWQEGPGVEGEFGPYWQSKRADIYAHYYKTLEEKRLAYPCFCSDAELAVSRKIQLSRGMPPRYPGTCMHLSADEIQKRIVEGKKPALRFHVADHQQIDFIDLVKGQQNFKSDDIGDFIIRRAEGTASFMFCNAIDDSLMGVTHILRGEDHLANTPRQLMILQSLGLRLPQYGHLSLITGDDGAPLSKRHGSSSLQDLRQEGFLNQAVLNYLARLGHAYDEPKLLSFAELAAAFRLEKLSKSSARFDRHQLLHWQKETLMSLDHNAVWEWLGREIKDQIPEASQLLFVEAVRSNITFPAEANHWVKVLLSAELDYPADNLAVLQQAGAKFFSKLAELSQQHGTDLPIIFSEMKTQLSVSGKNLFMPIRIALTGLTYGPELIQIANLLGAVKMQQRFLNLATSLS